MTRVQPGHGLFIWEINVLAAFFAAVILFIPPPISAVLILPDRSMISITSIGFGFNAQPSPINCRVTLIVPFTGTSLGSTLVFTLSQRVIFPFEINGSCFRNIQGGICPGCRYRTICGRLLIKVIRRTVPELSQDRSKQLHFHRNL